jgi:tRNA(fMet)-specific endonuclease VapC
MAGRYLMDTNAVIALFAEESGVIRVVGDADEVLISIVVLGELYFGARKSGRTRANIQKVDELAASGAIAGADTETARLYALVKNGLRTKGKPIPENDIWIAAAALQHGLTLLTRDAHFQHVDDLTTDAW